MIAQLQAHDPVAPLEVWREEKEGAKSRIMRYKVLGVQQITPITLKAKGLPYEPSDENPPLPVVVFVEVQDERIV